MEYWEYKADDGLILQTDPCHPNRNRSHCTKPSPPQADLRHSSIPVLLRRICDIPSFRSRVEQIHGIADWLWPP